MGFFRGVGKTVKPLLDFPKWMNAKQLAADASFIGQLAKSVITPQKATRKETFEEALQRLNLTEADLQNRLKEFKRLYQLFFSVFILILAYVIYLILDPTGTVSWRAILLATIVSGLPLVQFFRFHFWSFQIKKRKLGCSFKEYFLAGILGLKS